MHVSALVFKLLLETLDTQRSWTVVACTHACPVSAHPGDQTPGPLPAHKTTPKVCAPTGAGKTNIAMVAVLREVGANMSEELGGAIDREAFKVVYVAPMKALAAEVTATFGKRLEPLGARGRVHVCVWVGGGGIALILRSALVLTCFSPCFSHMHQSFFPEPGLYPWQA